MATNPPLMSQWLADNPGKTVYDYAAAFPPQPGTALGSQSGTGPVSYAPAPAQTGPAPSLPTAPTTLPAGGSVSIPSGPFVPPSTAGGTASTNALNKVVEPDANTTSGGGANPGLLALNSIASGGAIGNQEQTGNAADSAAGMFRALGRRNQPDGSLKLNRRSY